MIRKLFSEAFRKVLFSHNTISSNSSRSSIFFSPHPDDETLGCGGTIAKKCQSGEKVTIVLMTDGSRSHPDLISDDELKSLRKNEFLAATNILGVDSKNLIMLDFKDGELSCNSTEAVNVVINLLQEIEPEQIFVPYINEKPKDHYITTEVVFSAVNKIGKSYEIYEYPIWYWNQWPYCSFVFKGYKKLPGQVIKILFTNIKLFLDFKISNKIDDSFEIKTKALEQYASQMTRLINDERWRTLVDVSNGEFIECFMKSYEIFKLTKLNKKL